MTMFAGALTALVTPFRDGQVDEPALRDFVEWQISEGIDGLVPCGTTGESVNLSDVEYRQVVRTVVQQAKGRVPVLAGAGSASTAHTIELAEAAKAAGADGILSVTPYYNRPSQEGLVAHYQALASAVDLPLVLYNVPARTGSDLSLAALERLSEQPRIVAIKESTGTVTRSSEIAARFGDRFTILSGDDAIALPIMAVGGQGVISVVSNVAPREVAELIALAAKGEFAAARQKHQRLLPLMGALFVEGNPTPAKFALSALGRMSGELRLPLVLPTAASQSLIRNTLAGLGML